jgi:hypothetical protein
MDNRGLMAKKLALKADKKSGKISTLEYEKQFAIIREQQLEINANYTKQVQEIKRKPKPNDQIIGGK